MKTNRCATAHLNSISFHSTLNFVRSLLATSTMLSLLTTPSWAVPIGGGLQLWLDAADSSTLFQDTSGSGITPANNGDPVGIWRDKSGNGFHAVVTGNNAARRADRDDTGLGGRPTLSFTPGDGLRVPNTLFVSRPYTVLVVDEYDGAAHGRTVDSYSTNWLTGHWSNSEAHYAGGFVYLAGGVADNVPSISAAFGAVAANSAGYRLRGVNVTSNSAPTDTLGNVQIGRGGTGEDSDADISEVIIYNRVLTQAEMVISENYLSSKYSTNLNTGGGALDRYVGDTALNGNYDFGVFGIGQHTDASIVTSGATDGLVISEALGTLGSNEWVLAGHKTAINSINPDGSWARVWYIDKTETTGIDANLTFDFSDAGLVAPTLGNNPWTMINLLYSPTDPFSFSSLGIVAAVSGDQVSFLVPNAQLLDGYFTLQAITVPEPSTFALLGLGVVGMAVRARRRRAAA